VIELEAGAIVRDMPGKSHYRRGSHAENT
jgi:hypothetical protein